MSIMFWNAVALEVQRRDFTPGSSGNLADTGAFAPEQGGPTRTSRALAIVHIAMYDAVASLSPGLGTYTAGGSINLPLPPANADLRGAIAGAAVTTLQNLWKRAPLVAFVQERLGVERAAAVTAGVDSIHFAIGVAFGTQIGDAILAARQTDGHNLADDMVYSQLPYRHRPDPFAPEQDRLGQHWGSVDPFCIEKPAAGTQIHANYLGAPPNPHTQAARYNAAVADVKALGAATGSTRSADETVNGIFWGYDGPPGLGVPPRLYNQVVRKAMEVYVPGITVAEQASLLAMVHAGMADAAIVAWSAKYHYDLWRPVIGVREHDVGFGKNHESSFGVTTNDCDPSWSPLGAPQTNTNGKLFRTPGFPAYPSGHATFGAVSLRLLALFLATKLGISTSQAMDCQIEFVSDEFDGANKGPLGDVRPYHSRKFSLRKAIIDNTISRVHLGVHWRFDGLGVVAPDGLEGSLPADPSAIAALGALTEKKLGGVPIGLQIAKEIYEDDCFTKPTPGVAAAALAGKSGTKKA